MRRVITYGTFDVLHHGHIRLLRKARELGDYLIVGLSTDRFNELKGKQTLFDFKERESALRAVRYVNLVVPETSWAQKAQDIRLYKVDVLVMGSDWEGDFDHLKRECEVIYLPRTNIAKDCT